MKWNVFVYSWFSFGCLSTSLREAKWWRQQRYSNCLGESTPLPSPPPPAPHHGTPSPLYLYSFFLTSSHTCSRLIPCGNEGIGGRGGVSPSPDITTDLPHLYHHWYLPLYHYWSSLFHRHWFFPPLPPLSLSLLCTTTDLPFCITTNSLPVCTILISPFASPLILPPSLSLSFAPLLISPFASPLILSLFAPRLISFCNRQFRVCRGRGESSSRIWQGVWWDERHQRQDERHYHQEERKRERPRQDSQVSFVWTLAWSFFFFFFFLFFFFTCNTLICVTITFCSVW